MKRLLSLAVLVSAFAAHAVTTTWTRDTAIPANARLRQIATCGDGRVYGIDAATPTGPGTLRLLNGATGSLGAAAGNDSISCVNNVLHHFRRSTRELLKNDGTALGVPTRFAVAPEHVIRVVGGMVVALFIPVPTFVALTDDGGVLLTTSPTSATWPRVGDAAAAEQIVLAGGFLEHRLYAQNTDDALFENVGQGCNEYWRFISPGGTRADRPTVRAIATTGINKLTVLDDSGAIFNGVIAHEQRSVVINASAFNALNSLVLHGSRASVHQLTATFTPSEALEDFGMREVSIPLPAIDISLPLLGSTRYSPNHIDLLDRNGLTLTPSGRNVILTARFEDGDLEVLSSNWVYPNLNISPVSGSVTLGGKVGMCGQPEIIATAATFDGNFSGVENLFSDAIKLLNGDIRTNMQQGMLEGVQAVLAQRGTQLSLQGVLLSAGNTLAPPPGGGAWSSIVGNTFTVTGSEVRFTVER